MINLTLKLFIFFIFLTSCITVNYNPTVPVKKPEKVLPKKSSNINNSKPKISADKKRELLKIVRDSAKSLGECLAKLESTGFITKSQSKEFVKNISRGLKRENFVLFAAATKDDNFCIKFVPFYIDKDSSVLDDALKKY